MAWKRPSTAKRQVQARTNKHSEDLHCQKKGCHWGGTFSKSNNMCNLHTNMQGAICEKSRGEKEKKMLFKRKVISPYVEGKHKAIA